MSCEGGTRASVVRRERRFLPLPLGEGRGEGLAQSIFLFHRAATPRADPTRGTSAEALTLTLSQWERGFEILYQGRPGAI